MRRTTPSRETPRSGPRIIGIAIMAAAFLLAGCGLAGASPAAHPAGAPAANAAPIRIGAVFPISGNAAGLAGPELAGVRIAVDLVNADGGVGGHQIALEVRDLESRADADAVMTDLKRSGIELVIGAYSSDLSIAASAAADRAGLLYWEAGAVADRLTGRGLPMVFRVGASGTNLGSNSAAFAATELASRLGKATSQLRVALVVADDDYARSVADAAAITAAQAGMPIVARATYNLNQPNWPAVMAQLKAARPDTIILASHIPDGIAFRQAMLAADLKVGALIGSTMAECDPDFAGDLGADAVGIFASDRPTAGFRPEALDPTARIAYDRFAAAWVVAAHSAGSPSPSAAEYSIQGPTMSASAETDEEALAGFSAGWALFHDVLRKAFGGTSNAVTPSAVTVAEAARAVDLPMGSLPNGAGLRFSNGAATLGQNELAAAVIWQWQAVQRYAFVWPSSYATGEIAFVPLPR